MTENEPSCKKRVVDAVSLIEPDCIPIDFWATSEIKSLLRSHWNASDDETLLEHIGADLRYFHGPQNTRITGGVSIDAWGVKRTMVTVDGTHEASYSEVSEYPLAACQTPEDVDAYHHWPDADAVDVDALSIPKETSSKYAVVFGGDRLDRTAQLKTMMYLRGIEQVMCDLALEPGIVEAMLAHIIEYYCDYDEKIFRAHAGDIDIFMMGDDFGAQDGLLVSIDMWRRFFKKGFKAYIDLAHKYGLKVMHHTCGSVVELIPDFIECGLDILQSLQPRARGMDIGKLKKEFGKHIAFQGGIDIQQVLPFGTPHDVDAHVKEVFDKTRAGGGYIACTAHNIQPDTPLDNIKALIDAYHAYR